MALGSRYDNAFNDDPDASPYGWASALIPAGSRVLDLGCGNGALSAHLAAQKGCAVQAVDAEVNSGLKISPSALHVLDLERDLEGLAALVERFEPDVVLLLDVLEHLVDPGSVLTTLAGCVGPEALTLVSLPNVANASVVLRLLSDRFPYQEAGLLDATHLRFFTSHSAERAFAQAGLRVEGRHAIHLPLSQQEWRSPLPEPDQGAISKLARALNGQSAAYQLCFALAARPQPTTPEGDEAVAEAARVDPRLSVVVRFHDPERIELLDQALFSLAIQDHEDLEVLVVAQSPTPDLLASVEELARGQPWSASASCRVLTEEVPVARDGRSKLLNAGVRAASGRYLAFLDDDDLVYHHGYALLIEELRRSGRALAFGGCRGARLSRGKDHWFVRSKSEPFARSRDGVDAPSRLAIFEDNFTPINTFVIDRSRLGSFALEFDEGLSCLEDYDLLLRLCACFRPSFARIQTPVSEYRIREDGSNTVLTDWADATPEARAKWEEARAAIEVRKAELVCLIGVDELAAHSRRASAPAKESALLLAEAQAIRDGYSYKVAQAFTRALRRVPRFKAFARRLAERASSRRGGASSPE